MAELTAELVPRGLFSEDNMPGSLWSEARRLADLTGLDPTVAAITLVAAEGALELRPAGECVISPPPYGEVIEASLERSHLEAPYFSWQTDGGRKKIKMSPDIVWAPDSQAMVSKLERRQRYQDAQTTLVSRHELGKGSLALVNEFGGIDIDDPEATSRHLTFRTMLAATAGTKDVNELVQTGFLHPLLALMVGKNTVALMTDMSKIIETLQMLPEVARPQAAPALVAGLDLQAQKFIEHHTDQVRAAAYALSNPGLVGEALARLDELRKNSISIGSVLHQKLELPQINL